MAGDDPNRGLSPASLLNESISILVLWADIYYVTMSTIPRRIVRLIGKSKRWWRKMKDSVEWRNARSLSIFSKPDSSNWTSWKKVWSPCSTLFPTWNFMFSDWQIIKIRQIALNISKRNSNAFWWNNKFFRRERDARWLIRPLLRNSPLYLGETSPNPLKKPPNPARKLQLQPRVI